MVGEVIVFCFEGSFKGWNNCWDRLFLSLTIADNPAFINAKVLKFIFWTVDEHCK